MKTKKHFLKMAITLLCVFLVLTYASVIFLPHDHCSCSYECMICEILATPFFAILSCASIAMIFGEISIEFTHFHTVILTRNSTPVGLKVKLSN